MKHIILLFISMFCVQSVFAQKSDTTIPETELSTKVEVMPEPNGGMRGWAEYLRQNLRYPEEAKRRGIEGRIYVQFVVEEDGSLSDVGVLRGIGGGCDEEAIRVVKNAPTWKPGMDKGQPVRVSMVIPIIFKLTVSNGYKSRLLQAKSPSKMEKMDQKPMFSGGEDGLEQYLENHVKRPANTSVQNVQIVATVGFTVNKQGQTVNVKTVNVVPNEFAQAAEKIVSNFPAWKPGIRKGKPVSTDLIVHVIFKPE